jgi:Uma2 family endonuclease
MPGLDLSATATTTMSPGPGWIPSSPYRLTLEQYERLVDEGILDTRDRVHLIGGILVAKMTQDDPHCTADDLTGAALQAVLPAGWYIRPAKPIRLPDQNSKPEPDRAVVRGTIRDYTARTPGPADIGLVVEVSDSTLHDDRALASIYGGAGIPVCWIVNLVHRQVEVYSDPGREGYGARQTYREGQSVPLVIDGQPLGQIAVDDILPARPAKAEGNGA